MINGKLNTQNHVVKMIFMPKMFILMFFLRYMRGFAFAVIDGSSHVKVKH